MSLIKYKKLSMALVLALILAPLEFVLAHAQQCSEPDAAVVVMDHGQSHHHGMDHVAGVDMAAGMDMPTQDCSDGGFCSDCVYCSPVLSSDISFALHKPGFDYLALSVGDYSVVPERRERPPIFLL